MKRIFSYVLCFLLLFTLIVSANATESCKLYFDIDFEQNMLFSKYDIKLYFDEQEVATLPHGEYFTGLLENVSEGSHDLSLCRADKKSPSTSKEITIVEDSTVKFNLTAESQKIKISKFEINSGIEGLSKTVPDLNNEILSSGLKTLKNEGFTNITYYASDGSNIISESNWFIVSQEPLPYTVQDKNAPIMLKCDHYDQYIETHFAEHTVAEAYNIAENLNCTLTISREEPAKNIDQFFDEDPGQAEKWIVTGGSISSVESRKLKLKAYYTGNIVLDDYRGMKLSEAINSLEQKNVTNISYKGEDGSSIAFTSGWYVTSQSKTAWETIPANEGIFLTATKNKDRIAQLQLLNDEEPTIQPNPTPEPTVEPAIVQDKEPTAELTSIPTEEPTPESDEMSIPEVIVEPVVEPSTAEPTPEPTTQFKSIKLLEVKESTPTEENVAENSTRSLTTAETEEDLSYDENFLYAKSELENAIVGVEGMTYKYGNSGEIIKAAQKILMSYGYLSWSDGNYGDNTAYAIQKFQNGNSLTASGFLDLQTQLALILNSPDAKTETTYDNTIVISSDNFAAIVWEDGECYIGLIDGQNNILEGTYIFYDGSYYYGKFKNNQRSGQGTSVFPNGDMYVGKWENDTMNGKGIYYFGGKNSGEKYDGNWSYGTMSGSGTYTLPNGTMVTGTWENNKHMKW